MKRVITLLTFFLLVGLLLPACGISLEKRQHTGGYYVNVNPRKHALKEHHATPQPQETVETEVIRTGPEPVEPEELVAEAALPEPVAEQEIAVAETPAVVQNMDDRPSAEERVVRMTERMPVMAKVVDRLPVKGENAKKINSSAGHSGDALSLFWIVILILLVLWAAGLISGGWGMGWVINVLLIIALVLLILWLLRIV